MKLGIVGCGNIGSTVFEHAIKDNLFEDIFLFDIDQKKTNNLLKKNNKKATFSTVDNLVKKSNVIFEAATKDALKKVLGNKDLDVSGKQLIVMSVGGLVENYAKAQKLKHCKIMVCSGAIAGLDAIRSVRGHISSLSITTTKPPVGLEGAPFIIKNNILLDKKKKMEVFFGPLEEAIKGFPQNINVAATLFIASEYKNILVRIISDQKIKVNRHEIVCKGSFGAIKTITENIPSKNPKTSYLAILSALKTIDTLKEKITII